MILFSLEWKININTLCWCFKSDTSNNFLHVYFLDIFIFPNVLEISLINYLYILSLKMNMLCIEHYYRASWQHILSISEQWGIESQTVSVWKAGKENSKPSGSASPSQTYLQGHKTEKKFPHLFSFLTESFQVRVTQISIDVELSDCRGSQHQRLRQLYRCWKRVVDKGFWVWKNLYLLNDRNIFKVVSSFPPSEKDLWPESKEIWIYQKYLAKKTIRHSVTNHCSESFAIRDTAVCELDSEPDEKWRTSSITCH